MKKLILILILYSFLDTSMAQDYLQQDKDQYEYAKLIELSNKNLLVLHQVFNDVAPYHTKISLLDAKGDLIVERILDSIMCSDIIEIDESKYSIIGHYHMDSSSSKILLFILDENLNTINKISKKVEFLNYGSSQLILENNILFFNSFYYIPHNSGQLFLGSVDLESNTIRKFNSYWFEGIPQSMWVDDDFTISVIGTWGRVVHFDELLEYESSYYLYNADMHNTFGLLNTNDKYIVSGDYFATDTLISVLLYSNTHAYINGIDIYRKAKGLVLGKFNNIVAHDNFFYLTGSELLKTGAINAFVYKIDYDLNIIWEKTLAKEGHYWYVNSIYASNYGSCIICLASINSNNTDFIVDIEYVKLDSDGNNVELTLELENIELPAIYPNPFNNEIHIELISTDNTELLIFDSLGKSIAKCKIDENKMIFNMQNYKTGIYTYCLIQNGRRIQSGVLIKQ